MEQFETRYFRGQGPVFIEELAPDGTGLGLHFIGDCSEATAEPNVERFEIRENVSGVRRVGASGIGGVDYNLSLTMHSIRKDALALALRGAVDSLNAASATDESHVAHVGKFVSLDHVKVSDVVVMSGDGVTPYVVDSDYKVFADEGLIEILATGDIEDGGEILVDYSFAAQYHVKTNPQQKYFRLLFAGMNTSDSNKQVRAEFYRIQLDPSAISLITTDVEGHTLAGKVVHAPNRPVGDQLFSWKVEE